MTWRSSRGACPERQRGETEIFVLVVVILGAFLLAGGQLLFQSNTDSGLSQPGAGAGGGGAATPPATGYAIQVLSSGCDNANHQGNVSIGITGPEAGYVSFGLKEAGAVQITKSFPLPPQSVSLTLSSADRFNTNPWQIQLFSGGTQSGTTWAGGTQQATKDMDPTGCK